MPKREAGFFIVDMLIAIEIIKRLSPAIKTAEDLLFDEQAWIVITRELEIIGEAMKHVLDDTSLTALINTSWRDVVDFRNVVAHVYFNINAKTVFSIIKQNIPVLENEIFELLKKYPDKESMKRTFEQSKIDLQSMRRAAGLAYLRYIETLIF